MVTVSFSANPKLLGATQYSNTEMTTTVSWETSEATSGLLGRRGHLTHSLSKTLVSATGIGFCGGGLHQSHSVPPFPHPRMPHPQPPAILPMPWHWLGKSAICCGMFVLDRLTFPHFYTRSFTVTKHPQTHTPAFQGQVPTSSLDVSFSLLFL